MAAGHHFFTDLFSGFFPDSLAIWLTICLEVSHNGLLPRQNATLNWHPHEQGMVFRRNMARFFSSPESPSRLWSEIAIRLEGTKSRPGLRHSGEGGWSGAGL